jgi:hypothetical protein
VHGVVGGLSKKQVSVTGAENTLPKEGEHTVDWEAATSFMQGAEGTSTSDYDQDTFDEDG